MKRSVLMTHPQPASLSAAQGVSTSPTRGVPAGGNRTAHLGGVPIAPAGESSGLIHPKPQKREPAAPKRIRRSPIARKARAKVMPRCKTCAHPASKHQPAETGGAPVCTRCGFWCLYEPARGIRQKRRTPAAAIRRIADGLWSKLIKRAGVCDLKTEHPHECKGPLEAMHMIPRTFSATRWLPINGVCGCSGVHLYFTRRPELWSAVCLLLWGEPTFRELWALARASQPVDMDQTVEKLRAELARMEA